MDRWMDKWMDRWIDGWINGWMDGWMDGWMVRCIHAHTHTHTDRKGCCRQGVFIVGVGMSAVIAVIVLAVDALGHLVLERVTVIITFLARQVTLC